MSYPSLAAFLSDKGSQLAKAPLALIFAEDGVDLAATLEHHLGLGFGMVALLAPSEIAQDWPDAPALARIDFDIHRDNAVAWAINKVIPVVQGGWVYWGYNAEYLFYPFCETRNIRELLAFHAEERREAMLSYVIDVYAADLERHGDAVDRASAMLDRSGYYALGRGDPAQGWAPKERQMDFFGGLRWRFEEHVPWSRRRIDRIALFRARPGLTMREDQTFSNEEYNTFACAWHHNLTAAVCSFRTAKALRSNPGSRFDIKSFQWRNSVPFEWNSRQLMDLGLMEPGQWF
jgi:hypothetical protein